MKNRFRRRLGILGLVLLALAATFALPAAAGTRDGDGLHERAFLAEYAGFEDASPSLALVEERLAQMARDLGSAGEKRSTRNLTLLDLALRASGMAETVYPIAPQELERLSGRLGKRLDEADARNLAAAKSIGLIESEKAWAAEAAVPVREAVRLLYRVIGISNGGDRALGRSDDPEIYGRLQSAWDSFRLFDGGRLFNLGVRAIADGASTGYNIKSDAFDSRFVSLYTLQYGHSDIRHAKQLMALLNEKGLVARVALEPKTSSYRYLLEWGPVPEPSRHYRVDKVREDLYLASALEYDLKLEFRTLKDKDAFDSLVQAHAKKNDANPEGRGLLYGSWWQPLYSSLAPMGPGYEEVAENVVRSEASVGYRMHSFVLEGGERRFRTAFLALDPSLKIETRPRWCNEAFYRYLKGEHQ